ncbi:hypothetical protein BS50DRAFT_570223 [Corynespora cassiicola Philippines]|uniref:Uncharacterized protein n=1 Tax=Corynespora cassiicola Philippines TaxID=1448308 RepID=A0A2T2P022_CORCC|nr:hypothetical protein BS50DRAFT_570223 [Corynespora cassiicola Philippines]
MRVVVNEFQALINCLPIATVCAEARCHATNYCRIQIDCVNLLYTLDKSDMEKRGGNVLLEPLTILPTTVMVLSANRESEGPPGFTSAKHLVNVVSRVFGGGVQRIVLHGYYDSYNHLEDIYWPHTRHTRRLKYADPIIIEDPNHDPSMIFMTPNRVAHARIEFCIENLSAKWHCYWHLLKLYEVLSASRKKLPQLRHIDVHIQTYSWEDVISSIIKTTRKDDVLWVNWNDVHDEFCHSFMG